MSRARAFFKGMDFLVPGSQPLLSSAANHPALCPCLTFGWAYSWGFWEVSRTPFSLTKKVECGVAWAQVLVLLLTSSMVLGDVFCLIFLI